MPLELYIRRLATSSFVEVHRHWDGIFGILLGKSSEKGSSCRSLGPPASSPGSLPMLPETRRRLQQLIEDASGIQLIGEALDKYLEAGL